MQIDDEDVLVRKSDTTAIIVFIGNIPNGLADDHMIKLLHAAGNLRQWKRIRDNMGSMRSFGFVHFLDPISVLRCKRILDNYEIISPLGIKGKLAVRIDEKTNKQLDRWLQDNPKDGNAQFDAPFIAKVSAIVEELLDEKPMSYQLMNVEKEKTEQSVRQIHEQRRKAGMARNKGTHFTEKEDLISKFRLELKQWEQREKDMAKENNRYTKIVDYKRVGKNQLLKELENWKEESSHMYYTHRTKYLKERRPFRVQEEKQDGWNYIQAENEIINNRKRPFVDKDPVPHKKIKPDLSASKIPKEIMEIPSLSFKPVERTLALLRPLIQMNSRKAGIHDEDKLTNKLIKALADGESPIYIYEMLTYFKENDRIKFVQDIFRIMSLKSNK
eukprot:NODE_78_length_23131_cov_0.599427.p7 type:complete len:386 gc:universal NODE_78_length_23131_cov_0.599427:14192-13035(-)